MGISERNVMGSSGTSGDGTACRRRRVQRLFCRHAEGDLIERDRPDPGWLNENCATQRPSCAIMPFDRGYGGGKLMVLPDRSSDRKTFTFLVGIAALGLTLAVGVNFAVASLAPSPAPAPQGVDLRSRPAGRRSELFRCRQGSPHRIHRCDAAGDADGHQLRRLSEAPRSRGPLAGR